MKRRSIIAAGAAALALPSVRAQGIPAGPIRIVVGFPPGGGTDALARILAQKLQTMWNTTIVVENKAGAAGVIAADLVAKAPADGSVLLMAHINSHAIAPGLVPKLSYNVERDFSPIVRVGVTPNLLIAWPNVKSKTVKDIVAEGKANPGKLSFGSAGNGSAQHLALEMFKNTAKVDLLHVPYRGSGPLLADLMGGQILYSFDTMAAATPHVKSGKVLAIAQTRINRSKAYPDLPTLHDLGYLGFDASTWYGLVGPGKMPSLYVRRMNEDVNKVLEMPDVKEKLAAVGAEDAGGSPLDFERFIAAETKKWSRVIKDAKVKYEG
ncbi:tripartite tricarboxylate transporter substrate binding protein [Ramlibacter solisilvae]|uniref:LacI family transcriptional regulator n=1 Tax=Ramlibacter tataouinensis TaxID=94132 RepID=A0A127JP59_9BURK|nr:tripartite tricarboxylate transporter substrate binding protein [Ramlibacter tataouinensis]AMO21745.1 LacI family transcriptional regulator [Ramlibacter tataouinensis]